MQRMMANFLPPHLRSPEAIQAALTDPAFKAQLARLFKSSGMRLPDDMMAGLDEQRLNATFQQASSLGLDMGQVFRKLVQVRSGCAQCFSPAMPTDALLRCAVLRCVPACSPPRHALALCLAPPLSLGRLPAWHTHAGAAPRAVKEAAGAGHHARAGGHNAGPAAHCQL